MAENTEAPRRRSIRPTVDRLTRLTPATQEEICRLVSEGKTLQSICSRKGMPAVSTVHKWLNAVNPDRSIKYPEFVEAFREARLRQAQSLFEETIDIADKATPKTVGKARLRTDVRFRVASRLDPQRFGEHATLDINHSGEFEVVDPRVTARVILGLLNEGVSRAELGLSSDIEDAEVIEDDDGGQA